MPFKSPFLVAYVEINSNPLSNVGCYVLPGGVQLFDAAIPFAANLNMTPPAGYVKLDPSAPDNAPMVTANPQTIDLLQSGVVGQLQSLGIAVVLSVLGNHDAAGWSNFTDDATGVAQAEGLALQLANIQQIYGLDGFDIDDEWSDPPPIATSLAMVTWYIRQRLPGLFLSKALYADSPYFDATWNGPQGPVKLAENLTYGWEMYYDISDCSGVTRALAPYVKAGMSPQVLAAGVSTDGSAETAATLAKCVLANKYGGMMVYDVKADSTDFLSVLSDSLYGVPTTAKPGCLSTLE